MAEVPIMVMPWHRPDPCEPPKMQTEAAFKASYVDYLSSLSLESPTLAVPLTGIMCTIGPASNSVDMMIDLMEQGMTIALVPLAIGIHKDHVDTIANIRKANIAFGLTKNRVFPLGIALQTKGPGVRIGGLYKDIPIELPLNHKVTLSTDRAFRTKGTQYYLYISLPDICQVLSVGDLLQIGSGNVILQVQLVSADEKLVDCKVVIPGVIHSFMSVSIPDVPICLPPLTEEDVEDLKMAAELGVDIVVASHTQTADHILQVRKVLDEENDTGIKVWAQIESKQSLENLESILKVVDAVLFSRVSLLQDLPPEKLFLAQKVVISSCNKMGVPVFVSSHFLPSMQEDLTPSIAEMSDVAAAILDGADGFTLRRTTASGKHPHQVVKALTNMCLQAEAAVWHSQTFSYLSSHVPPPIDPTHAIAISAVEASIKCTSSAILLATTSGRSAQVVAKYRPRCPIIAVTRYGQVARQLNTWRAIIPLHYIDPPLPEWPREVDVRLQFGIEFGKELGIVHPGDTIVLLNGWRQGAGFTNTIRVVYASESFPWVYPHKLSSNIPLDKPVTESEQNLYPRPSVEPLRSKSKQGKATAELFQSQSISSIKAMQDEFTTLKESRFKELGDHTLTEVFQRTRSNTISAPLTGSIGNTLSDLIHPEKEDSDSTKASILHESNVD